MSANPKRRDLELAVIDAAIEWVRTGNQPYDSQACVNARDDLRVAVLGYSAYGLAAPQRTRTVMSAPDTSHEAGEWMKQFALTDACAVFRQIYFAWRRFSEHGDDGFTCDEVERALDRTHQSISARINELRDTGWIIDSGERRKTRSGRNAVVWTPTQAALDLVDRAGLPIVVTTPRARERGDT